jgi:hypothetical protein
MDPPPFEPDGAGWVTAMATDCVTEPPDPVHVKVSVTFAAMDTAVVPLSGSSPFHPELPEAVQDAAFWLDQVSCTVCPGVTVAVLAVKVRVGTTEAILTE